MDSRMNKYDDDNKPMSRTKRNSNLYSSIKIDDLSRIKTNNNVSVISEAPKQIDLEKIKKYIYSMNSNPEENTRRRVTFDEPVQIEEKIPEEEPKEYDVNSILEKAKDTRESNYEKSRYRKFNDTEYDILKKIKMQPKENPDVTGPIDELNTEEKTIVDLINEVSKTKVTSKDELFSDLMGDNENTIIMAPITDEINTSNIREELDNMTKELDSLRRPLDDLTQDLLLEKERLKSSINETDTNLLESDNLNDEPPIIEQVDTNDEEENTEKMSTIDKSFFTNSLSFNKGDFEGFEELEKSSKKSSFYTKFAIIMIVLVLIATAVIVLNYVLDLKWF